MFRKTIATLTAVTAALLVVGVAWASGDDDTSTSVTAAGSSSITVASTGTSLDGSTVTSLGDRSTSTSLEGTTATSLDDDGTTATSLDDDGTTSTSLGDDGTTVPTSRSTTSTSAGSSTSTSFDDSDVRPGDGRTTHNLPGVGTVTIEVRAGALILVDVNAPGWNVELDKVEHDRIEIEFTSGEAEAEFEARIEGARVDFEMEIDSD